MLKPLIKFLFYEFLDYAGSLRLQNSQTINYFTVPDIHSSATKLFFLKWNIAAIYSKVAIDRRWREAMGLEFDSSISNGTCMVYPLS